jgi:diguanylate cyclase (GGDEF)-like protein/PAS domain S-box-containing protein
MSTDQEATICRHQPLLPACLRALAGSVILGAATIAYRVVQGLPIDLSHLLLPALLGALGGTLLGGNVLGRALPGNRARESDQSLQALFGSIPAMLHCLDADGRLTYVSQAWLDTLGYCREEVIGRLFSDFVVADDPAEQLRRHRQRMTTDGAARDARFVLRRADGREVAVALNEALTPGRRQGETVITAVLYDLTRQMAAEEQAEKLAYCDSLTGLPNRTLLNDRLLLAIAKARRDNCQVGVFFFDLDRFKTINDTLGHAVGDLVLRSVAQRLKKFIREGDTLARLGGDEFVIVQADPNQDPNFAILARRILETLGEPFRHGGRTFFTTASIGVAVYPHDGEDCQTLLQSADTAMYVAKSLGRNNFQFFSSEINAQVQARAEFETRLRQALHRRELTLHYQPQIDLATGRIVAVEALLRWYDAQGEPVAPVEMISVAEESGLIFPLGEWTLEAACRQAYEWRQAGLPPLRMAVNLSGHHIRQSNFVERLLQILEDTGMTEENLEIELHETAVMGHIQDSILTLTDLKVHGIHLVIDDFGKGYSSLLYLKQFPIQRIKIAQEFISDIGKNPDYRKITEAIISMGRSLNLSVTAVGVETAEELAFLRRHGCTEVAGSFLSPALPPEEIARLVASNINLLAPLSDSVTRQ